MKRKSITLILAVILAISFLGVSFATENGNKRKGKYTYRKVYKSCQQRGEVDSATPPISPADKTQDAWKKIFEKQSFEEFGCKNEWSALSETEITDIYAYLHSYAADSPSPAKCK